MYRHAPDGKLAGRNVQWLTEGQAAEAERLLVGGATQREAAEAIGITWRHLRARLTDQLKHIRVGQGRVRKGIPHVNMDIPADLIWLRAAELRRGWPLERWLEAGSHHRHLPTDPGAARRRPSSARPAVREDRRQAVGDRRCGPMIDGQAAGHEPQAGR